MKKARVIAIGQRGSEVVEVQKRLAGLGYSLYPTGADGIFGPATERAVQKFQRDSGLSTTGRVGARTWQRLLEGSFELGDRLLYLRSPYFRGRDVRKLQRWLTILGFKPGGKVDGIFGPFTETAAREFQGASGIAADGIVGPETIASFRALGRALGANRGSSYPKVRGAARRPTSALTGRQVVLDCGGGLPARGVPVASGSVAADIALRLANLLELLGARVFRSLPDTSAADLARLGARREPELGIGFSLARKGNGGGAVLVREGEDGRGLRAAGAVAASLDRLLGLEATRVASLPDRAGGPSYPLLVVALPANSPELETRAASEEGRQKVAVAAFDGIKDYLQAGEGAS